MWRPTAASWLLSLALVSANPAEHQETPSEHKEPPSEHKETSAEHKETPSGHKEAGEEGKPALRKVTEDVKGEIAGYARLAKKAIEEKKWPLADHFLQLVAEMNVPDDAKKVAFQEMAAGYQAAKQTARATAIYEKMTELFPDDPATSALLFQLGVIYRESGLTKLAINRFYSVLNSALQTDGRGMDASRELAKRAQWEIAQTYFMAQDFSLAKKFFELFGRLELTADEQSGVRFQLARCRFALGDVASAVEEARKFLSDYPQHVSAPECRYLLASALREMKKPQESLEVVLELLKAEEAKREGAPKEWLLWQKKAGNEFANNFYREGDYHSAVSVYQALARLDDKPEWLWPVIYQMGLCFERLKLPQRAAEAYRFLVEDAKKPDRDPAKMAEGPREFPAMARWRGEQLAWHNDTDAQLARLLGAEAKKPTPPPALRTPSLDPVSKPESPLLP